MDVSARSGRGEGELLEIKVEMLQRVRANLTAALAPCFPVAERLAAVRLGASQSIDGEAHRPAQEIIAERGPRPRPQIALVHVDVCQAASGAPSARSSSWAMCKASISIPRRCMRPAK